VAAETIQDFLVSLGYSVKGSEERQFTEALNRSKVAALATAAALAGVVAAVAKVAESYEQLFYASQRMGASVANIQALAYGISQVGGSAEGARQSLEAIGSFLRSSPGSESLIARLGVQTRDANGNLRDTSEMLTDLGRQFRTMPYYRAQAYAGVLGIDERTLQALIRGTGEFSGQLKAMYRAAGIDATQAAAGSAKFMQQLRGFGAALQVLRDKVGISLEHGIGGDVDRLRRLLVNNFGRISDVIVAVTRFVLRLGEAFVRLVGRAVGLIEQLVDWFNHLDKGTKKWIETIGALTLAWYVLNRTFLASPIGRIVALGLAILGLYDDYKTWKEGGKSLIDWSQWEPAIEAFLDSVSTIKKAFQDMWPSIKGYLSPLMDFLKHELVQGMKDAMADVADLVQAADDVLHRRWSSAKSHLASVYNREVASSQDDVAALGNLRDGEGRASGGLLASPQVRANEASGYGLLRNLGIPKEQALGMLGNFEQESSLNPAARNGHHYGIEQWSDDRADAIKAQTGIDVKTAGYADQLKAAVWEITRGNERANAGQFFNAKSIAAAAGHFGMDVERSGEHPGIAGFDNRIANSLNIDHRLRFADAGSGPSKSSTPTVNASTTINVHGAGNPAAVGQAVRKEQDTAVANIVRNMAPLSY
jgi:hypothetical protein